MNESPPQKEAQTVCTLAAWLAYSQGRATRSRISGRHGCYELIYELLIYS